jgi:hypothetical protein
MLLLPSSYHTTPMNILFILLRQMIVTLTTKALNKASAKVWVSTNYSFWHFLRFPVNSPHICKHNILVRFCFQIISYSDSEVYATQQWQHICRKGLFLSRLYFDVIFTVMKKSGGTIVTYILYNVCCPWYVSPFELIKFSLYPSTPFP